MYIELKRKSEAAQFETDNDYLSLYEQKFQREKQMERIFYEQEAEEQQEVDSKRPALFRRSKKLSPNDIPSVQKDLKNMTPEHKSFSELKQQFHVSEDKNQIDHLNNEVFQMMFRGLKDRQIAFYAFLNKEFNVLNYKSARCSFYCFDDTSLSVFEANKCVGLCREGIQECRKYAQGLQDRADKELKECQEQAASLKHTSDPIIHWISWYEKLVLKFDEMEVDIKSEFSNFI